MLGTNDGRRRLVVQSKLRGANPTHMIQVQRKFENDNGFSSILRLNYINPRVQRSMLSHPSQFCLILPVINILILIFVSRDHPWSILALPFPPIGTAS